MSGSDAASSAPSLYHERQHLAHCAIHSLNNLFQGCWLTYQELSQIAADLHSQDRKNGIAGRFTMNPYLSTLPLLGSFDIQCIAEALKKKNAHIANHIAISSLLSMENLEMSNPRIIGYIINEEASSFLRLLGSHHWYAVIRRSETELINLDSNLSRPQSIGTGDEFIDYLRAGMDDRKLQIFVIKEGVAGSEEEILK